MSDVLQLTL